MTILRPIREEGVALYLAAAFAVVCGRTAISTQREKDLLRQTIAVCDAQLDLAPTFPLPPDDAPIRAALVKAMDDLRTVLFPHARSELEKIIYGNKLWNAASRYASKRLAVLQGENSGGAVEQRLDSDRS